MMNLFHSEKKQPLLLFVFFFFVLHVLNYSVYKTYAFADEYNFAWQGGDPSFHQIWVNGFIMQGRMLIAWSNDILYPLLIQNIKDYVWLRILSLFFYAILALQMFRFLSNYLNWQFLPAICMATLCISVPGVTVHIGWAATFSYSFAELLAFIAGVLLFETIFQEKKHPIWNYTKAVLLLIISLSIYQPSFTMVILPIAFYFIANKLENIKKKFAYAFFCVLSIGIYYLFWKLTMYVYALPPDGRSGIELEKLPYKMAHFYTDTMRPMYSSNFILLNGYSIWIGILLFITNSVWMIYQIIQKKLTHWNFIFLLLAFPATFGITLVLKEYFECSRTMQTTAMLTLFFQTHLLFTLYKKHLYGFLLITFLFLSAAFYNQNVGFAGLQAKEYAQTKTIFTTSLKTNTPIDKPIAIIRPKVSAAKELGLVNKFYSDELGIFSAAVTWAPSMMFRMVALEHYKNDFEQVKKIEVESYAIEDTNNIPENALIIDLDKEYRNIFSKY